VVALVRAALIVILVMCAAPVAAAPPTAPVAFEPNHGQLEPSVLFRARGRGFSLLLAPTEMVVVPARGGERVRLTLLDSAPDPLVLGADPLRGRVNYYRGTDPSRWRTGIPMFGRVEYRDVYPGIDLVHYVDGERLQHDFVVRPGGHPGAIRLAVVGGAGARMTAGGDLVLATRGGEIRLGKPVVYQQTDEGRVAVDGRFELGDDATHVRFAVGAYDRRYALVIDPPISYARTFGGAALDLGDGVAFHDGKVYVGGSSASGDLPVTDGTELGGPRDGFVGRLSANGTTLEYLTYLGGDGDDIVRGIAVDDAGNAWVTGFTEGNLPLASPATRGAGLDAYVAKLDATGLLVFARYLGGSGEDEGNAIAISAVGHVHVAGTTASSDFAVGAGAVTGTFRGVTDAFVVKLDATGAVRYVRLLGGTGKDEAFAIGMAVNRAVITGRTNSPASGFTRRNALQPTRVGIADAFITKLGTQGTIEFSTFLGGDGDDAGRGVGVDRDGNIFVTGGTTSQSFTAGTGTRGSTDVFVAKMTGTGDALAYTSFFGGSARDIGRALAVNGGGNAHVAGITDSVDFPTANPNDGTGSDFDAVFNDAITGATDAFVVRLNASGDFEPLAYATYIGFGGLDSFSANGIAIDPGGNAYVTGRSADDEAYVVSIPRPDVPEPDVSGLVPTTSATAGFFNLSVNGSNFIDTSGVLWTAATGGTTFFPNTVSNGPSNFIASLPLSLLATPGVATVRVRNGSVTSTSALPVTVGELDPQPVLAGRTPFTLTMTIETTAEPESQFSEISTIHVDETLKGVETLDRARLISPSQVEIDITAAEVKTPRLLLVTDRVETQNPKVAFLVVAAAPDLRVTAASTTATTVPVGATFTVQHTVKNAGTAPAVASTSRFYLSTDTTFSAGDRRLTGRREIPSLAVNAKVTTTTTVRVPSATPPGNYRVLACADDLENVVPEPRESNCRATDATVAVTAP
jgi:hypothetical protein